MIPIITLVGRPNVGKSTLFNRLTRTHDALVADFPRSTRDRRYGCIKWKSRKFIIVDTGGIDGDEKGIENYMVEQSLIAIKEADIVLFMVDAQSGLMESDQIIAQYLRSLQKITVVIVNKTDGTNLNSVISDFYSLGMSTVIPISSSHGRGINNLLNQLLPLASQKISENNNNLLINFLEKNKCKFQKKKTEESLNLKISPIKIAVIGRPNVGKSMLINCILGEERMIVYNAPGTTRDSIYIPLERAKRKYILIDTAGIRRRSKVTETIEKISIIKTLQAIEDANVVILVIDTHQNFSNQDLFLLNCVWDTGRSIVIAVNKWDTLSNKSCDKFKEVLDFRLRFIDSIRIHFISALYNKGINNLFESVNEAYQCATKQVSTALLTRIMRMAIADYQPPLIHGLRVKPKYAHAGGYNPLIIVIHGTQVQSLSSSYKHYLTKYFRRSLKIMGTPLRIQFNKTNNPFVST